MDCISIPELGWAYNGRQSELVLMVASMLSNIRPREYALTVDAIEQQLRSRNLVTLASDGWTSMNQFATTSVIAQYMDHKCACREVELAVDEVDRLFLSYFER